MRLIIFIISAIASLLMLSNCDLLLPSNPPKYRIQNTCDFVVDFKIIPTGSDTIRYNNIENNTVGDFKEIREGDVHVIGIVHGKSDMYTNDFVAKKNGMYTLAMHDGAIFGKHIIHLTID